MSKKILVATASALVMGGASTAMAQNYATEDTGFYIGGGYTFLDVETDNDIGDNTNAATARLGYQFTPNWSVEGEGTFGVDDGEFDYEGSEDDFDFDANNDGDIDDALIGTGDIGLDYQAAIFGRYTLPVSDRFDVFARAGYGFTEIDSTIELADGTEFRTGGSENGAAFGAGAAFDVTESSSIRADYTRYEYDEANADAGTVSYEYKF
ncbi:porin family protein [Aquisalinus flavus]|uniref:Outer membrane protein beta-barrel domain-containing protein n=1 Tax=Aquisalinus flavus TaxID=1526572 RepID=A0A8J2Y6E7_9PROT|nr:porin family protein [Aquisalinus flavus]MBD0426308.1 porin family protein [Aquisalinus flavus]GGD08973.1 hypothetical protein GCM10011342_17280 [Aquisalinus flavus]